MVSSHFFVRSATCSRFSFARSIYFISIPDKLTVPLNQVKVTQIDIIIINTIVNLKHVNRPGFR